MSSAIFDQALAAARQLSPQERARLIGTLAEERAAPPVTPVEDTVQVSNVWEQFNQLREEFHTLYPNARFGTRLEADRAEREASKKRL